MNLTSNVKSCVLHSACDSRPRLEMSFNKLICNYCFRNWNKWKVWRLQRQIQQSILGADSNAEAQIQEEEDAGDSRQTVDEETGINIYSLRAPSLLQAM